MGKVHYLKTAIVRLQGMYELHYQSLDSLGKTAVSPLLARRFKLAIGVIERPCDAPDFYQATAVAHFLGIPLHAMAEKAGLHGNDLMDAVKRQYAPKVRQRGLLLDCYAERLAASHPVLYHPSRHYLHENFDGPDF